MGQVCVQLSVITYWHRELTENQSVNTYWRRTLCSTWDRYVCNCVSSHTDTRSWHWTLYSTLNPSAAHWTLYSTLNPLQHSEPSVHSTLNPWQHTEPSAAHGTGMCAAELSHTDIETWCLTSLMYMQNTSGLYNGYQYPDEYKPTPHPPPLMN